MPERASINQLTQIGPETTPGTVVPATKIFSSLSVEPAIKVETVRNRPQGYLYPTSIPLNKEWTEADISSDAPNYDELAYLFSSLLKNVTPSTSGTTGKLWSIAPSSTGGDTIKTFSIEKGSSVRAMGFGYGLVTGLTLSWSRDKVSLSGSMIGQKTTDSITLTAALPTITNVPILPTQIDVYLDTTSAGLGGTKLTRVLSAEWSLDGRYNPAWFLNSAIPSFAAHVESEPTGQLKLMAEADAAGMGPLANLRAGDTVFVRVQATGPVIGAGPAVNSLKVDLALQVEDVDPFSDEDGIYAIGYTFGIVHNATWTKAMNIDLINSLASL